LERTVFDYSKLKGRIKEKCGTQKSFAKRIGITESSMTCKLNCDRYFTQDEIMRSADILDISPEHISTYFFAVKVQ